MTRILGILVVAASIGVLSVDTATPKFFPDDPITADPETQDARGVADQTINDLYDTYGARVPQSEIRALNVNTLDEVPDSSWWTNRILATPMTPEQIARGANTGNGPVKGTWTIVSAKTEGRSPGFRIVDPAGQLYFVKFDPLDNPEMASGAEAVTTPLFHALGYNVPENYVAALRKEDLRIGPNAKVYREFSGQETPLLQDDVNDLLGRVAANADGSYRVLASMAVEGKPLGPFRYHGTRPDDPNDVFAHEHRRELRGMRVFAAWLNHDESRSINSLDSLVERNGRHIVKHFLLDFGSTLGSGTIQAQRPRAGNEYLWEARPTLLTMVTLGLYVRPWIKVKYPDMPSVGHFEGAFFQPQYWKPEYPNPAFDNSRPDDLFWAARRVAAFADEGIRAAVANGKFTDKAAELYLGDVIIVRRDKVARHYLNITNPVVDFAIDASEHMTFKNAAVDLKFASAGAEYRIRWARFDNATGDAQSVGEEIVTKELTASVPRELRDAAFIRAIVTSHHPDEPNWVHPVHVFFRKQGDAWKLVGLERLVPQKSS